MSPLFTIEGIITEGKKRGRSLGYPTANMALREQIPSGIYISLTMLKDKKYPSLTFIGEAKTFNEFLFQSETYILDFSEDIYGQKIAVDVIKKIRDNEKFTSVENLVAKMKEDEKSARAFFEENTSKYTF